MTALTNTFTSAGAVGVREDLSDMIWNVSPYETPFTSSIAKVKATQRYHEWQTDALATPNMSNYHYEGDDISTTGFDAVTATARLGNYCQILNKSVVISDTLDKVNKAGRKSEVAYQVMKKTKEIKIDCESIVLSNQAKSATDPRKLAGIESWLGQNSDIGTGAAANPATFDGAAVRVDGTTRTFAESSLQNVVSQIFAASANAPDFLLLPPKQKQKASTFTNGRTGFIKAESKTASVSFDVYASDFGDIKLVPSLFNRGSATAPSVLAIRKEFWALAQLRPLMQVELAKTGDCEKRALIMEVTLESRNAKASGIIADLS